jgi:MoxR-like ATPase
LNTTGEFPKIQACVSSDEILKARNTVKSIYMDEKIEQYILDIVFATREPEKYNLSEIKSYISYGGSPRASISLAMASRAYAFLQRRAYVIPEDIKAVVTDVLRHRIGFTFEAEAEQITPELIIDKIIQRIDVP